MFVKNDIFSKIIELAEHGVFEIWYPGIESEEVKNNSIYIPYMMNDALECYIILEKATLVGRQIQENKNITQVNVHEEGGRFALVAKQGKDNTFTIFFEDAKIEKKYYEYGRICHFWEKGQEQWGQLVYIIGTMYDKYAFLGEESCNEVERSLLELIEFAPFRYHAPAKQLFEDLYETTRQGSSKMMELSKAAGDFSYYFATAVYHVCQWEWLAGILSKMLTNPHRYRLYEYIYKLAVEGAGRYSKRKYSKELEEEMQQKRKEADNQLKSKGYSGEYPEYIKENVYVRVTEEHPFTLMDWENASFKQTLMVSECSQKYKGFNMGFFKGRKLKGYCCSMEEFNGKII